MIILILTLTLYAIVGWLLLIAYRRRDGSAQKALVMTSEEFLHLLPRLAFGVIGSGFIARLMPQDLVIAWLGPQSGVEGLAIASLAGALTPGGPVVGFALGSAAIKAGAGAPQVIAYVTGWSLFTLNRVLIWEIPFMPAWFVRLRVLVSLPIPFFVAWLVMLIS
jgi:uncharacterized membrane protein YraQ (UPF0718 family)